MKSYYIVSIVIVLVVCVGTPLVVTGSYYLCESMPFIGAARQREEQAKQELKRAEEIAEERREEQRKIAEEKARRRREEAEAEERRRKEEAAAAERQRKEKAEEEERRRKEEAAAAERQRKERAEEKERRYQDLIKQTDELLRKHDETMEKDRRELEEKKKRDDEAVAPLRQRADQGDAEAQLELGDCYFNGKVVTKDVREAVKWYRKAAEQGHARAQLYLGTCFLYGTGVAKDKGEAALWLLTVMDQQRDPLSREAAIKLLREAGILVDESKGEAAGAVRGEKEKGDGAILQDAQRLIDRASELMESAEKLLDESYLAEAEELAKKAIEKANEISDPRFRSLVLRMVKTKTKHIPAKRNLIQLKRKKAIAEE